MLGRKNIGQGDIIGADRYPDTRLKVLNTVFSFASQSGKTRPIYHTRHPLVALTVMMILSQRVRYHLLLIVVTQRQQDCRLLSLIILNVMTGPAEHA